MIQVLYFASLRERLGCRAEALSEVPRSVSALRGQLSARGGVWAEVFAEDQRCLLYTSDAADEMSEVLVSGGGGGVY